MYIIANNCFPYHLAPKKQLLNIHPHSVRNLTISIIANLTEIHKLGKVPGCWKDKLRTTAEGNV